MKILFLNYIDNGDIWKGFDNKNNKILLLLFFWVVKKFLYRKCQEDTI